MNHLQTVSPVEEPGFSGLRGARVLLVEDVEFNIMIAENMLNLWKVTVDVAINGMIAVKKARENQYDLILMDLQMPVMDGYNASLYIRQFNRQIPIIAVTASAPPDIKERIGEFGISDFIEKPFKSGNLYNTMVCWLQKSQGVL
jgi:CheY-like chemotaxis protein